MEEKYRILYVDDEQDNLTAFRAVLRRYYHILTAQSGAEALKMLAENEVDLVISDQRMPKMTGVELFEQISALYPDIIRMVLTGYSDVQSIIDAINKGKVNHFITKPWNVKELRLILDNALETYVLKVRNKALEQENSQLMVQTAKMEKEHVLSQFEILKNQINPHFLFNSMNILTSLIPRSPQTAVKFTKQFSKVFRTLLEMNEELTIPLEQELDFIKSYLFLQKMRFDKSLQIQVRIAKSKLSKQLPPFGLQLLIENAIKHNIISEEMPLKISIANEGDYLKVVNNLQLRGGDRTSTGIGLKNLKARYKMLTDEPVLLEADKKQYSAKIPLI
ncbi:MAG: histidine kinase [Bacteroidota bacterium]